MKKKVSQPSQPSGNSQRPPGSPAENHTENTENGTIWECIVQRRLEFSGLTEDMVGTQEAGQGEHLPPTLGLMLHEVQEKTQPLVEHRRMNDVPMGLQTAGRAISELINNGASGFRVTRREMSQSHTSQGFST